MKLSDIEKTSSNTINKKMQQKLGWSLNLSAMTVESAHSMMESIDSKLSAFRSSHKLHESQNSPSYTGMIMAKKVLESFVIEAELKVKPDFADVDGDGDTKEPMKKAAADKKKGAVAKEEKKVEVAERKDPDRHRKLKAEYENLTGKKAPAGTSTQAMQIIVDKAKREKKDVKESFVSKKRLMEDELSQAQAMLAAKDMVDSLQDMIEEISKMLNEQLPPLTDSIRASIGTAQADSFKASASATLSSMLTTVQSNRDAMDQAVRTLSGESGAVAVPGAAGADPMADVGSGDDTMDLDMTDDDFAASDAAAGGDLPLGREKR